MIYIYLVRKDHDKVAHVTFSKRRAIARAAKLAHDRMEELTASPRGADGEYELTRDKAGSRAKVWCSTIHKKYPAEGPYPRIRRTWVGQYWVQEHQLLDSPLEMIAGDDQCSK